MAFEHKPWQNDADGGTPISAAALIDMEQRLSAYTDALGARLPVNIRAFGAAGDGVVDDTAALVAAIAAVPDGGTLYLPPGTYLIDCSPAIALPGDIRIVGAGEFATTLQCSNLATTDTLAMFEPATGTAVALADLTVQGPATIGAGGRFDVTYLDGASGALKVTRCRFIHHTTALRVSSTLLWQGVIDAEGCTFEGYGDTGAKKSTSILLNSTDGGTRNRRLRVHNCVFRAFGDAATNLDHAIYVNTDWDVDISTCEFLTSVGNGYAIQLYDEGVTVANRGLHQKIRGCRFGPALTTKGIVAAGVSSPVIEDCIFENVTPAIIIRGGAPTIRGCRFLGIIAADSHIDTTGALAVALPVTIEDNEFLAKSTKIISIRQAGDYIIKGNRFAPGAGSSYFISVEGSTPTVRVIGNDFRGAGNSGIIRISVAGALHVKDNTFLTSGGSCVELSNAGATATVLGNEFSQSAGTSVTVNAVPTTYRCVGNYGTATGMVNVASAATVTLPEVGDVFNVTGTTAITALTASWPGRRVTLKFASTATLTDGGNIRLDGNASFVATADDTISLVSDGTNWLETSRAVN